MSALPIINWQTNYNNKLGCQAFSHIDRAPANVPSWEVIGNLKVEIRTKDNSHPPKIVTLVDIEFAKVNTLTNHQTLCSHGFLADEYITMLLDSGYGLDDKICVYYYQA